jgi:hypothetical protein
MRGTVDASGDLLQEGGQSPNFNDVQQADERSSSADWAVMILLLSRRLRLCWLNLCCSGKNRDK